MPVVWSAYGGCVEVECINPAMIYDDETENGIGESSPPPGAGEVEHMGVSSPPAPSQPIRAVSPAQGAPCGSGGQTDRPPSSLTEETRGRVSALPHLFRGVE